MKVLLFVLFACLGFVVVPIYALYATELIAGAETAKGIEIYFISVGALASIVMPVTQVLKKILKTSGNRTKILSWAVSFALSLLGWWLGLGMLDGLNVFWVLAYGFCSGLVANSIFDMGVIQAILKLIKEKV